MIDHLSTEGYEYGVYSLFVPGVGVAAGCTGAVGCAAPDDYFVENSVENVNSNIVNDSGS